MTRIRWMIAGGIAVFGLSMSVAWWEVGEAVDLDVVQTKVAQIDEREVCRKCREQCVQLQGPEFDCWEFCRAQGDC